MEIKIERLASHHLDGLCEIENTCFSEPWSRNSLVALFECDYAVYFVATDENGKVCGYCGMYTSFEVGAINNVGVLPEYRRNGIAAKLLSELVSYSKKNGISTITLEVRSSNTNAIALYKKQGFSLVGTRKNYYKKPTEDALLYNLEIKQ